MKPHPNRTRPHGRYAHEKFFLRSETLCRPWGLDMNHMYMYSTWYMTYVHFQFPVLALSQHLSPRVWFQFQHSRSMLFVHLGCHVSSWAHSWGAQGREEFWEPPAKTHPEGRGDEQEAWQGEHVTWPVDNTYTYRVYREGRGTEISTPTLISRLGRHPPRFWRNTMYLSGVGTCFCWSGNRNLWLWYYSSPTNDDMVLVSESLHMHKPMAPASYVPVCS